MTGGSSPYLDGDAICRSPKQGREMRCNHPSVTHPNTEDREDASVDLLCREQCRRQTAWMQNKFEAQMPQTKGSISEFSQYHGTSIKPCHISSQPRSLQILAINDSCTSITFFHKRHNLQYEAFLYSVALLLNSPPLHYRPNLQSLLHQVRPRRSERLS